MHGWWECKLLQPFWKIIWRFLKKFKNRTTLGRLGGSVSLASGHHLTVCEFEPHIRFCADSLEPGACFGFCLLLSLTLPTCALSVSQK